jgi:hypothetical protein
MQSCPVCFAVLRASDLDLQRAFEESMRTGRPMPRPPGRPAFAEGPDCSVHRLSAGGPLVVVGRDGFVEATIKGSAPRIHLPLRCAAGDEELFRLERYAAAPRALVAVGPDRAPLATFLAEGLGTAAAIDVRDATSAPVARVVVDEARVGFEVVETGYRARARIDRDDIEDDDWVDDGWSIELIERDGERPWTALPPMALVALAVAVKVLWGRPAATRRERPEPDDEERLRLTPYGW